MNTVPVVISAGLTELVADSYPRYKDSFWLMVIAVALVVSPLVEHEPVFEETLHASTVRVADVA